MIRWVRMNVHIDDCGPRHAAPRDLVHLKVAGGQAFLKWLISDDGQGRIAAFKPLGKQLFFPNAR